MGAAPLGVTAMKHITAKLKKYVAKDNHLGFDALHGMMSKANAFQMVNSICYDKEEQPKLYIDKTKDCPEMIPLKCTHGANENKKDKCTCYGVANFLGILEALKDTEEADELVEVMIWKEAIRQGKSNRKEDTKKELHPEMTTIKKLVDKFKDQMEICISY